MSKKSVYCRKLEDDSGFIVAQPIVRQTSFHVVGPREFICDKWEKVAGLGRTRKEAQEDYKRRNQAC